ncbi:Phosphorylated carbohydrates phosphatase [Corynebacterium glaucum]|uniref:Phosphorylated carbohydrates phosphatase n=1 Tax=Corynebacterium glaucum TaxID=187491 RepID=A0A1Q2HWP1_9CORY|nr:HAD family phosphatase [Corynebacterium glaucum]AQQ15254.1 Phosphorylated carbohydrates phosphatase [Corynebacterium glaucum]
MSSAPAAVFWDMDGTLIDTEPQWGIATYELGELLARPLTAEVRERTVGGSFESTLRIVAEWAGHSLVDGDVERYKAWMYARMRELLSQGVEVNPGVGPLLAALKKRGTPMLVCTNTERVLADACIDVIGREFFVDTITGDEVARAKPHPDMYVEAARRVGADPSDCLVFEDSWNGMSAGAAAGCVVLGLASEVPDGVTVFDPARFVGADASDVDAWFTQAASA